MRPAASLGSGFTMLAINTSTGRSSTYGFARSWKSKNEIPDWLVEILNARCPGFLETEKRLMPKAAKNRPLPLRLEDWIDDHIFAFAKQEGWFNAITYYAIRDPRYQRAEVCWSECVEKWKKAKPIQYPSFEEWKGEAAQCDETAHLTARERKARASAKLVASNSPRQRRLPVISIGRPLRIGLDPRWKAESEYPTEVVCELERRCPGFLDATANGARNRIPEVVRKTGSGLMLWIG